MRALFSPVVNELNLFNPDAIERQFAHVPQNRIHSAYNRAQYWDESKVDGVVCGKSERMDCIVD